VRGGRVVDRVQAHALRVLGGERGEDGVCPVARAVVDEDQLVAEVEHVAERVLDEEVLVADERDADDAWGHGWRAGAKKARASTESRGPREYASSFPCSSGRPRSFAAALRSRSRGSLRAASSARLSRVVSDLRLERRTKQRWSQRSGVSSHGRRCSSSPRRSLP
jgi:hypothetical protein